MDNAGPVHKRLPLRIFEVAATIVLGQLMLFAFVAAMFKIWKALH